jgi:hypothetical protein
MEKVAVCGKGESVETRPCEVPAVSKASHPGHLVNQSTPIHHNLAFREVILPVSGGFRSKCFSFTRFEAKRRVMEEIGKWLFWLTQGAKNLVSLQEQSTPTYRPALSGSQTTFAGS